MNASIQEQNSNFPLLIKLSDTGEYAAIETTSDLPNGKSFKVLRTKYWFDSSCCGPHTNPGDRVIFIPLNGYPFEHETALQCGLEHLKTYIVNDVTVHHSSTDIVLNGFEQYKFNSVMFLKLEDHE